MTQVAKLPLFRVDEDSLSGKWTYPQKKIYSAMDIPAFHRSTAISRLNGIISLICESISGLDVPPNALDDTLVDFRYQKPQNGGKMDAPPTFNKEVNQSNCSATTRSIMKILDEFAELKNETPALEGPRRYGNLACRDWHDKLTSNIDRILKGAFYDQFKDESSKQALEGFCNEIKYYLLGSFGSRERLDYGTGHELSFISFLGCLVMVGFIKPAEMPGSEWLLVLAKYYDLVKSLILVYTLEPAGSHGVWGLDDHFHLVYIFGSCQLIDFKALELGKSNEMTEKRAQILNFRMGLTPSSILNVDTLKTERTKNFYFNAISFIKMVKIGPFSEHSPILYEISASKNWEKVARGMLKMYYGEVLSKFPVVQHFYFGGVFYPWTDANTGSLLPSSGETIESSSENESRSTAGINEPGNRYNSELNSTMNTLFSTRQQKLTSLLEERKKFGFNARNALTSSRPLDPANADNTTRAPWSRNSDNPNLRGNFRR